jgi:cation:H+ antiporter
MFLAVGLLVLGAIVLYAGAELAVRGAAGLARATGLPAFALGALLFGIDLEGLGAAIVAAARGQTAIAAGEIFGTILFLFSAAFGAALLFAPRPVPSPQPAMILAPAVLLVAAAAALFDRFVSRLEGVLLVALYAAYVGLVVRMGGRYAQERGEEMARQGPDAPRSRVMGAGLAASGLALLVAGAWVLLSGGVRLVEETDLLAGFVGAAILGILVSLDEVLLEVIPIRRGAPELATGNLFGTLAAFCSGVLGVTALVRPLDVDSGGTAAFLGAAFLYAVVGTVFLLRGRAGRVVGAFVLACYAAWLLAASAI